MTLGSRRLSVRTRLALIYTALLAAALVVFGSGMYLILRDQLEVSFDRQLVANAEHAAGAFAQDVGPDGALRPDDRLVDQFASTGGRVVVLDTAGMQVGDSAPAGAPPLPIGAVDIDAADRHAHLIREVASGGDVLRLTVEAISVTGRTAGYVAWADSTRPLRDLLTSVGTAT